MQLRGATASHVGNVRDSNQDRVHFGGYTGVVADGMGGHQGGEMAASIAISEFVDVIDPIAPGGLVELVEDANRAVFERAADPDLRGMGTTLVALTLRPAEGKVSVVNVGDSRAYFLRGDEFGQLTLDHSLVEDLVRQNRLTREEALTHPQRNILTRALGIASEVEVDVFLIPTMLGDRFLLCSDGLFNEVDEDDIVGILRECPEPNAAADKLVTAALAAQGRDNVTVAVIDVVDDGHGGDISSQAAETLLVPAVTTNAAGSDGADGAVEMAHNGHGAVGVDVAEAPDDGLTEFDDYATEVDAEHYEAEASLAFDEAELEAEFDTALEAGPDQLAIAAETAESVRLEGLDDPDQTSEMPAPGTPKRKRRGRRAIVGLLFVGLLAAGGWFGFDRWTNRDWFVYVDGNDQLAVFRESLFWGNATEDLVTEDGIDTLTVEARDKVLAQERFASRDDALTFIEGLPRDAVVTDEDLNAATGEAVSTAAAEGLDAVDRVEAEDGSEVTTTTTAGSDTNENQGTEGGQSETNTTEANSSNNSSSDDTGS